MATKKAPQKPEEGATYYFAPGGTSFKAPKIDVKGISAIIENKAIEEGLTKQQRILFQHDPKVSVMNLKTKEIDPDLTSSLSDMVQEDNINLSAAIQRAWRDTAEWGPALHNPIWDFEGSEFRMKKLKRLEPWSFAQAGTSMSYVYNKVLPGIRVNDKTQQIEYWQTDTKGRVSQLYNVEMLTDPIKNGIGGSPAIVPIFPLVKMLTYSWMRQMQKVNQYGSGGIWFLKVEDPTPEDKKFAQTVMNNVSAVNRYQLKPNMKIENLGINESGSALETITQLGMEIRQFFTPAGLIQKDGSNSLIGGSNDSEFQLYMSFIAGTHRWLEAYCRRLFNPWIIYNGYYEKRFRIVVEIPAPTIDKSELYLSILEKGTNSGSLLPNEKRELLRAALPQQSGIDISDLDEPGLAQLKEYTSAQPQLFSAQLQKAEVMTRAVTAGIASKSRARSFLQATLGLEEGEPTPDIGKDAETQAALKLAKAAEDLAAAAKEGK